MRAGIRHPEELSLCRPGAADDLRGSSDAWLDTIRKQIFAEMNPDAPAPSSSRKRSGQKSSTANGGSGSGSRKDLSASSSTNLLASAPAPAQSQMSLRDGPNAGAQRAPELYTSASIYETEQQKSPSSTLGRTSTSTMSRTNLNLNPNANLGVGGTLSRSQASVYAGALTLTRSGTLAIIDENTPAADGTVTANTLPPVSWRELHEASAAPLRTRTVQQRARLNAGYA